MSSNRAALRLDLEALGRLRKPRNQVIYARKPVSHFWIMISKRAQVATAWEPGLGMGLDLHVACSGRGGTQVMEQFIKHSLEPTDQLSSKWQPSQYQTQGLLDTRHGAAHKAFQTSWVQSDNLAKYQTQGLLDTSHGAAHKAFTWANRPVEFKVTT
jgi:hypothetical protein